MNQQPFVFLHDYVFPNYFLPNALPLEAVMINYINSQNSNATQSFTMEHKDSLYETLYDKNKPMWPNSVDGSSLLHPCYQHHYEFVRDSVYNSYKYKKYVYVINIGPHVSDFARTDKSSFAQVAGDYFYKNMSPKAYNDVRAGRAVILLDFCLENFVTKQEYEELHRVITTARFPTKSVILAINSCNADQIYASWFPPGEQILHIENVHFLMHASSHFYSERYGLTPELNLLTKDRIRKYHFLSKNRRPRNHRQAILLYLKQKNLLDKCNWSYLSGTISDRNLETINIIYNLSITQQEVNELNSLLPKTLVGEPTATEEEVSAWTDKSYTDYQDSYLYICTETYTGIEPSVMDIGDTKSLTEKVFKPLGNFMPFIFVAFPGALEELRKLGFKTFHPYIDESYDQEPNHAKRMNMILTEIERLGNLSSEEMHEWYWAQWEVLLYNQQHLINMWKKPIFREEFIKLLEDKE